MSRLDATRRNGRIDKCHPFDLGQFAGEKGLEVTETCRDHAHREIPVARHQPAVNDLGELEDRALKCCQSVVDLLVQLHRHEDRYIKPSAASSTRTPWPVMAPTDSRRRTRRAVGVGLNPI